MEIKRKPLWQDISEAQWNNWRWQYKNRITTVGQLDQAINISEKEKTEIEQCIKVFLGKIVFSQIAAIRQRIIKQFVMLIEFIILDEKVFVGFSIDLNDPGVTSRVDNQVNS